MWIEQNDKLCRTFLFDDFQDAFSFMTKVAEVADQMNHHPWWANVYNKVEIELTTHDAGNKVTQKDLDLAEAIDAIFDEYDDL